MLNKLKPIILICVVGAIFWFVWQNGLKAMDNKVYSGWLEGEEYLIQPEVSGKIKAILVTEGQLVGKGTSLVQLDDQAAKILLDQAKANFNAAEAKTSDLKAGSRPQQISQAKAQVQALNAAFTGAEESYKRAQQHFNRVKQLAEAGGATAEQLEVATTAEAAAKANLHSMQSQIKSAQEQVRLLEAGATSYNVTASTAQGEAARQQVNLANLQLAKYQLTAPVQARVEEINSQVGELANPGATLIKLIDDSKLTVTIYIPQSQLNLVKVGQKVQIKAENGNQNLQAQINYIASKGEFTPKNIQTQEQRATQVFAVKVVLNSQQQSSFKPGQAVEVYLD